MTDTEAESLIAEFITDPIMLEAIEAIRRAYYNTGYADGQERCDGTTDRR